MNSSAFAQATSWLTFANAGAVGGAAVTLTVSAYGFWKFAVRQVEAATTVKQLRAEFDGLSADHAALKGEFAKVKEELAEARTELAEAKLERTRLDTTNAQLALALAVQNQYIRPPGRLHRPAPHADRRRVLVVDDDIGTCRSMQVLLEGRGFDTAFVCTRIGAMAVLEKDQFHAVVLDLHLPDGDALDVLRQVRGSAADVRVVVITGFNDRGGDLDVLKPDGVLVKPVDFESLVAVIRGE